MDRSTCQHETSPLTLLERAARRRNDGCGRGPRLGVGRTEEGLKCKMHGEQAGRQAGHRQKLCRQVGNDRVSFRRAVLVALGRAWRCIVISTIA